MSATSTNASDLLWESEMTGGARGEWHPDDVVGCAARVGKIGTGRIEDKEGPAPAEAAE